MTFKVAHGFVDGGYLRFRAQDAKRSLLNPRILVQYVADTQGYTWSKTLRLERVTYYDAIPDNESELSHNLKDYWDAVELLPDTQLGFGSLRGGTRKKPKRQKGVDTLIAVDMLVGVFTGVYSTAVLVAGDADFVPVINEVQRRGAKVIVAGVEASVSSDLRRAADRFVDLDSNLDVQKFPPLKVNGREWKAIS